MTDQSKGYISLDENQATTPAPTVPAPEAPRGPETSNSAPAEANNEMSTIENEMAQVAENAFNAKRAEAHAEIDRLYDEMIASAKRKVQGITASIVAEVSGQA